MDRVALLLATIAFGGALGGWAAFLIDPVSETADGKRRKHALLRACVMGIIAAACVPLFLKLAQTGLVNKIFDTPAPNAPLPLGEYFIFLGLCLVAAFSAHRVMGWLSDQLLNKGNSPPAPPVGTEPATPTRPPAPEVGTEPVTPARPPAPGVGTEPTPARPLVSAPEPVRPNPERDLASTAGEPSVPPPGTWDAGLTDEEFRVLKSLTLLSKRTATGVAESSGIQRMRIGELLDVLADKGLVTLTVSDRTKGPRWQITPAGVEVVRSSRG